MVSKKNCFALVEGGSMFRYQRAMKKLSVKFRNKLKMQTLGLKGNLLHVAVLSLAIATMSLQQIPSSNTPSKQRGKEFQCLNVLNFLLTGKICKQVELISMKLLQEG